MKRLVLAAGLLLASGLGVLFGYCNGRAGLSLASTLSSASVDVDVSATGVAALIGVGLTLLGAAAFILAWLVALFSRTRRPVHEESEPRRRGGPFRE